MAEKISVLIAEDEINNRIQEMADELSEKYAGKTIHLIGILTTVILTLCPWTTL